MNSVPNVLNEDVNMAMNPGAELSIDTEPSNIISLSQQGLLLQEVDSPRRENFAYHQFSPLNEW